jgi:tetratricopeptide (TPR) repeat protein
MKFSKQLTLMALATAMVWSTVPAYAQETAQGRPTPQSSAPSTLKAESLDDTKPNGGAYNDAAKAINHYIDESAKTGIDAAALRAETMRKLEDAFRKDEKSIPIRAWLGYLNLQSGNSERAIELLEPAAGKSADPEINRQMLENLGAAYYQAGNFNGAESAYERLTQMPNATIGHYYFLGNLRLVNLEDTSGAIAPLQKAREMADAGTNTPLRNSILRDLGIALMQDHQDDAALNAFEALEASGSTEMSAEILSWMGFSYLQQKKTEDAIRTLEKAHEMEPDDTIILTNLGNAYERRGSDEDIAKAISLYMEVADSNPNLATPWYNIGSLHVKRKEYTQAIEPLKKAIQLGSQSANELRYAHNNLGYSYEMLKRLDEAAAEYATASDLDPSNAIFARNAGMAYFKTGNQAAAKKYLERANALGVSDEDYKLVQAELNMRSGNDREALAIWESLSESQGSNPDVWFNIGVVRHRLKDYAGAEAAYRKVLDIRPDDSDALNNLGLLLYDQQKYTEALEMFQKISSADHGSVNAQINLGAALLKAGRKAEAIEVWKTIVRDNPNNTKVRTSLADGLWSIGDKDTARFHYATVLKAEPNNARALNGMGLYYLENNKAAEAEANFRKAIAADANFMPPYNNLAVVLERKNKVAEAILLLEKALKIDPNFEEGRKTLGRLKSLANG